MNNGETITAKELAESLNLVKTTILRRAEKEGWPYDNGGNRVKHFLISQLPEDVRLALAATAPPATTTQMYSRTPVGSPDLADWQNRVALAWADLVRAYLAEKKRAKTAKESVTQSARLYIKGYNTGQLLPAVFRVLGATSFGSVEAKVKKFRDSGYDYAVLAPQWGGRKGRRKVTDHEFNVALSFVLHPNRLRIAEVTRLAKLALAKRGLPSPSSEATMRRALEDWKKTHYDQWVFCREGEKALTDKCLPYLERDAGLLDVGEVLVADGHKLNFQILHPFTGKPARMALIVWYDWASCMPTGWEIMPTENIQCVAASLRRAIMNLGKPPRVAYLDNGKAFKAKVFTGTDIDFEEAGFYGMFARLGIETVFAWPYNAQAKPVERFFGTFNELERLMPTYTGASIADKPAHMLRNEKLHKKIHEKKYGGWVPTVEEADQIVAGWFKEYAARPHRGLKGLCPGEVFLSGRGPGVDEQALRFLMMSKEVKRVHRNGVSFRGRNYYDEALYGFRDRVLVRYDLGDLSRVFVYDLTGARLVCEARPVTPVHPVARITGQPEDLALVKQGIEQKRSLKKSTEQTARTFVENTPALVQIPARLESQSRPEERPVALPRGEAERIEAEAAKMKVLEIKPREPDPLYLSEPDRYEALLERECQGQELLLDDMTFMRYFERTDLFKQLESRFEFLREFFLAGPEEEVQ